MDVILSTPEMISSFGEVELGNMFCEEPALLCELVQIFSEQLPFQLTRLESALAEGDQSQLRRAAHQFIGSCIVFSATEAVALGRLLEACQDCSDPQAGQLVSAIAVSAHRLLRDLKAYISNRKGAPMNPTEERCSQ